MLVGVAPPPSLIPTLWTIGILHYKQAKLHKDMQHSVTNHQEGNWKKIIHFGKNSCTKVSLISEGIAKKGAKSLR